MYADAITSSERDRLVRQFPSQWPAGVPTWRVEASRTNAAVLQALFDPEKQGVRRRLTREEQQFIRGEQLQCLIDFRYFAERYVLVNAGGLGMRPLYPLWDSQRLVLDILAQLETAQAEGTRADGCLLMVLKARQLGVSTLAQALLVHRVITQPDTSALTAADVTEQSRYLFEIGERILTHLPWFLKPLATAYVTSGETPRIALENGSIYRTNSGKSMRGQKVEDSGTSKGELGRGRTYSAIHLSELSTWEYPEQIDSALFPGLPLHPAVLAVLESTAKGRQNWWHRQWQKAIGGLGRAFAPVFIPWYAEPDKYHLPAPVDWIPSTETEAHARLCESIGPRWLHRPVTVTRDQLYWYERERAAWAHDGRLAEFLAEYPATPEECFQFSGRSIFALGVRERIRQQARPATVWTIDPDVLAADRAALLRLDRRQG